MERNIIYRKIWENEYSADQLSPRRSLQAIAGRYHQVKEISKLLNSK